MSSSIPSSEFLPLSQGNEASTWLLDVRYDLCSGRGDLWGGIGLAAAMDALSKEAGGRPIIWASAQFISNHKDASQLSITTDLPFHGRNISQGSARGTLDGTFFMQVSACLGQRKGSINKQLLSPPQVPLPDQCPEIELGNPRIAIHQHTELRLARGQFGMSGQESASPEKQLTMWVRMPKVHADAGSLTILADYMISGIGSATGGMAYGVSLDNTIRIAQIVPTDWVLCDVRIEHISDGLGYGTAHLWSDDMTLMATASQSFIVRVP